MMGRKQFANSINPAVNTNPSKEDANKFRSATTNMGNVYKEANIDNAPVMLASLEKLYKSLMENQQKIESLTQVGSQMSTTSGNQPYY